MAFDLFSLGGALLGGLFGGQDQTQTQTAEKSPWGPAQPYILDALLSGSKLNQQYQQNPFSPLQLQAFANQFGNTQNLRNQTNSLQQQMSNQRQFDRSSPLTRPIQYDFGGGYGGTGSGPAGSTTLPAFGFATNPFTAALAASATPGDPMNWAQIQANGVAGGGRDGPSANPGGGGWAYDPNSLSGGLFAGFFGGQPPAPVVDMSTYGSGVMVGDGNGYGGGYGGNPEGGSQPGGTGRDGAGNPGIGGYGFQ